MASVSESTPNCSRYAATAAARSSHSIRWSGSAGTGPSEATHFGGAAAASSRAI